MKFSEFFVFNFFVLTCFSNLVFADGVAISGGNGAVLTFDGWDAKTSIWKQVGYKNNTTRFSIYGPFLNESVGVGVGLNSDALAPNKKFIVLQRTVFGMLSEGEQNSVTEKSYCDMISVESGCVLLTRPAESCSGSWKAESWVTDAGELIKPELETTSPQNLVKTIVNIADKNARKEAIKAQMFMGVQSYMACFPPAKNVQAMNDIGFYLAGAGDDATALNIYKGIEGSGKRTVLMLNIADSLWNVGHKREAKNYYKHYLDSMLATGSGTKVPVRVKDRTAD